MLEMFSLSNKFVFLCSFYYFLPPEKNKLCETDENPDSHAFFLFVFFQVRIIAASWTSLDCFWETSLEIWGFY